MIWFVLNTLCVGSYLIRYSKYAGGRLFVQLFIPASSQGLRGTLTGLYFHVYLFSCSLEAGALAFLQAAGT